MNVLIWLLACVNIAMIGWGILEPRRLYRFPVFAGAVFMGFAMPQLIGLSNETGITIAGTLPDGAIDVLVLVSILCLGGYWLGDIQGVAHPGRSAIRTHADYNVHRLVQVAFGLTMGGVIISQIGANIISQEEMAALGNQWSGPVTIIMFFQAMQKYGFALSVLLYLRTRSPLALVGIAIGVLNSFFLFFAVARRGATADTFFILLLALYFAKRIVLPAWLLAVFFVFGTLWTNSVGSFRGRTNETTFIERLENADMFGMFNHILTNGGFELANAAMQVHCADYKGEFDFGRVHWNQLVHSYFPGQIFGHDLKKSLKFTESNLPEELYNYKAPPGTTQTGMADAFCSFWYLGCLKFYLIGYMMGRWYNRSHRGDLRAQLAYMSLMSAALHTITHGTYWLFNNYIHMVIFAYPALHWARHRIAPKETGRASQEMQLAIPA